MIAKARKRINQWLFSRSNGDYDAVDSRGRRKAPVTASGKSEDSILTPQKRDKLIGTTQDVRRNFAVAAWAIRQHLNYVSAFTFQAKTGNDELDSQIETFIDNWGKRTGADVRKRHPFRRMIRLAEAMRIVQGDFGFIKIAGTGPKRGKLQAIEGDRIVDFNKSRKMPDGFDPNEWTNGVKTNRDGEPTHYSIGRRTQNHGQLEFERIVPARNMFIHGCYDRFDQLRGISPIASALNGFKDVYEGFDYALGKIKVAQLFGLSIYSDAVDMADEGTATIDSDGDDVADSDYEIDFSGGPQLLKLKPGDRAEFLQANTPAQETVEFLKLIMMVSLKALDIPYSFFDESFTNFYGSRAGLSTYLRGAQHKIDDLRDLLDDITRWRLGMAIVDGDIVLPSGVDFDMVKWDWVPVGVPWWDPSKEIKGHQSAVSSGLDNPQRICRSTGTDFYENIDKIAEAQSYASSRGVNLSFGDAVSMTSTSDDTDYEVAGSED